MKLTQFALFMAVLANIAALQSATRHAPWGTTKAVVWLAALTALSAMVGATVRAARRLPTERTEASQQAVYRVAMVGLILVTLALSLPQILPK